MNLNKIEIELIKGNQIEFIYNNKTYRIYQGEVCEQDDVFVLIDSDNKTYEKYFFKDLLKVKINGMTLKEMLINSNKIKIIY